MARNRYPVDVRRRGKVYLLKMEGVSGTVEAATKKGVIAAVVALGGVSKAQATRWVDAAFAANVLIHGGHWASRTAGAMAVTQYTRKRTFRRVRRFSKLWR